MMRKVVAIASFLVIILAIGIVFWKGGRWAAGFLTASAWSIANCALTIGLLENAVREQSRAKANAFLIIKFPVLYLAGFALLVSRAFPTMSMLTGLLASAIIFVIIKMAHRAS